MEDTPEDARAARSLRRLMRLVTVLMVVMIVGLIVVVALMALKLTATPAPVLPEAIRLPDGAHPRAVTVGEGWMLVLTDQGEVLVFDTAGTLRQRVVVGN